MALHGKMIKLDNGHLAIECRSTHYSDPKEIRHVWELPAYRIRGLGRCAESDAIGKAATVTDGRISCYVGNGIFVEGELPQGGSTPAIVVETTDIPRPKVRAGIETRWSDGQWQKYTKARGWIAA
jgi:hypothetical protein